MKLRFNKFNEVIEELRLIVVKKEEEKVNNKAKNQQRFKGKFANK
jgi:hypothetical protein